MSTSPVSTRLTVLDILGVDETSPTGELYLRKPSLAQEGQDYYNAIFSPTDASASAFPLATRAQVAIRTASYTGSERVIAWYSEIAAREGASQASITVVATPSEPIEGSAVEVAALRHTDLLATSPSSARPSDIQALKDAGISPAGILALSQTIAFVTYQVRVIAGLRALGNALEQGAN